MNTDLRTPDEEDPSVVSEDAAADFVGMIRTIVDDTINERMRNSDIMRCGNGKVTAVAEGTVTVSGCALSGGTSATDVAITRSVAAYVDVLMDEKHYDNVLNRTGEDLSVGDYVKVVTCDGVSYYALYKI